MGDFVIVRTATGSKVVRPGEKRIINSRVVDYEKEKASIERRSRRSKSNNKKSVSPRKEIEATKEIELKSPPPITPPEEIRPKETIINDYSTQQYPYIPDGGVNQGTQIRNEIPKSKEYFERPISTYSAAKPPPKWSPYHLSADRLIHESFKFENKFYSDPLIKPLAQAGGGFTRTGLYGIKGIIDYPTTTKNIFTAFLKPEETGKAIISDIKTQAKINPAGLLGSAAAEVLFIKSPELLIKGTVKIKDSSRVRNRDLVPLGELTTPEIVAQLPEQKYPYYGETPSELVAAAYGKSPYVAKIQDLFGTDKPMTYTVSPHPLTGTKVVNPRELGLSGSETPIISSSPYAATTYAKIGYGDSGASRIVSNNPFDILKGKPQITVIISDTIKRPPASFLKQAKSSSYKKGLDDLSEGIIKTQKQGETYTAPTFELGKPEAEFATFAGQEFSSFTPVSGKKYYTIINDRKVPIDAITLIPETKIIPTNQINKIPPPTIKVSTESIIKGSKDLSSSIHYDYKFPKNIFSSFKEGVSEIKGSSNIYDASNIMVLQPLTQEPSSVISSQTGSIKPSYEIPSGSSGKEIFDTSKTASIISYDLPSFIPPPPLPSKTKPSKKDSSTSTIYVPPPSIIPPSSDIIRTPPSNILSIISPPPTSIIRPPPSSIPRTPPIYTPPFIPRIKQTNNKTGAYNVLVRRKGVFRKINIKPLTKTSAINLGTYKVGATAAATFKLQKVFGKATTQQRKGNIQDFYRKQGLFIEKRGKRIKSSSIGELQEITFKGIRASKNKKKRKKKTGMFGEVITWGL